jgi:hypothetical protein
VRHQLKGIRMTTSNPTAPQTFMVVATFHPDTDFAALQALLPASTGPRTTGPEVVS